ncbi:MAG: RecQ family ATP-dependent DNA helicase [Acidobacteriota bacterium]
MVSSLDLPASSEPSPLPAAPTSVADARIAADDADATVPAALRAALGAIVLRVWGHDGLRPLQPAAMHAIAQRRDSLVVLPTGGGKSLCYQVPALLDASGDAGSALPARGVALVISPLIALMKDQVDGLVTSGVPAAYFNSSLTAPERQRVLSDLRADRYRLLYVAPERLSDGFFLDLLREVGVRYIVVDEAHCISQWGHDFRPEYRQLAQLRAVFPDAGLHAFTATATARVSDDIVTQLALRDPAVLIGPFDRPNLTYRAIRRTGLTGQLNRILARHEGEAGIIYCLSRRQTEQVAGTLQRAGHRAVAYHAGLSDGERASNQEAFLNERVDIVVATVAFGMGIDRSDVRFVIHATAPKSLEHYQQEAGRAGRDGLGAECVLLHSPSDFLTWKRMMVENGEFTPSAQQQIWDMEAYAVQTRCRHAALASYFGQVYAPPERAEGDQRRGCGACDWCLGELEAIEGSVTLARKILACVARLRQRWGVGHVVDVLRGRETEKIRQGRHDQLSTYGLLPDVPPAELRSCVEQLVDLRLLQLTDDRYPTLRLTESGLHLMKTGAMPAGDAPDGKAELTLYRHARPPGSSGGGSGRGTRRRRGSGAGLDEKAWEGVDRALFEDLRALRKELAADRGVPPYVIFQDTVLRALARERPADRAALLEIRGIGEKKAEDLGPAFLDRIANFGDDD